MGDDLLPELGDLLFSMLIGYAGALEFLYVVRHLYHWTCGHSTSAEVGAENLKCLQDRLRNELVEAADKEQLAGTNVMQDGVPYKDGFRLDRPQDAVTKDQRRKEIEAELERQKEIEEQTRKELEKAEAELIRQRTQEEENTRKLLEAERLREEEERHREKIQAQAEAEATAKRKAEEEREAAVKEIEKKRLAEEEEKERIKREHEENEHKMVEIENERLEAERQKEMAEAEEIERLKKEEQLRKEEEDNAQKMLQAERQRVEAERLKEIVEAQESARLQKEEEENVLKMLEVERQRMEAERQREIAEAEEIVRLEMEEQQRDEEIVQKMLEAEREREEAERQREMAEEEQITKLKEEELLRKEEEDNVKKMLEAERQYAEANRRREEIEGSEEGVTNVNEENELREEEDESKNRNEILETEPQCAEANHRREMAEAEEAAKWEKKEEQRKEMQVENEMELLEIERQIEKEKNHEEISDVEVDERQKEGLVDVEYSKEQPKNEKELLESEHELDKEEEEAEADEILKEEEERAIERSLLQLLDAESDRQLQLEQEEQERALIEAEREFESRQRLIEENARKFIEADQEMEELQQRMLEATQQQQPIQQRRLSATESAPQTPVFEEPCIRKTVSPLSDDVSPAANERLTQTVKTQFGQTSDEPYSVTTKPLLFKSISDDTSSIEPPSTLSTQQSEEFIIDTDDTPINTIDVQLNQLERPDPEGEDNEQPVPQQFTDDYLRSLDGIKQRPLIREDGSGRRRAFKKRRSSGSSNSSHGSREEEVKMFTSLEEEELQAKKEGEIDFAPLKYNTEPLLKVKSNRRRHKRSPAKDIKTSDGSVRSSLEMLDEENSNPWGEMPPEHYKDMAFWKQEKSMSIDEEEIEFEKPTLEHEVENEDGAEHVPNTASFEDATHTQNEEAITVLQKQQPKEIREKEKEEPKTTLEESARSDINPNLQSSQTMGAGGCSTASPRLRRSPRIEEMDHYEERWMEKAEGTATSAPSIIIQDSSDNAPWRDQHGLIMEGLSDFYDFAASVNPSRSRPTSREPSPSPMEPNTSSTENVAFIPFAHSADKNSKSVLDVYDDTGNLSAAEVTKENIVNFIESLQDDCTELSQILVVADQLKDVADTPNLSKTEEEAIDEGAAEMSLLVQTLRVARGRSRSQSRSPLPTSDNLEKSLENRRNKMIKHNDELFEKLNVSAENMEEPKLSLELNESLSTPDKEICRTSSPLPTATGDLKDSRLKSIQKLKLNIPNSNELRNAENFISSEIEVSESGEHTIEGPHSSIQSLHLERSRSRSRSQSRSSSPLPTPENLQRSLNTRRYKLIQQNDALFEKMNVSINTGDENSPNAVNSNRSMTPIISVECCDELQSTNGRDTDCSREEMSSLIESLRQRRSQSKSPMWQMERERTPEPQSTKETIPDNSNEERERRSRTPSRSASTSPSRSELQTPEDHYDFHMMLNLEASSNKTLTKCTEEMETILAEKQRLIDQEALYKLSTANEEMELRTITPIDIQDPQEEFQSERTDNLGVMPASERMRQLRCSPTTPDYDRSISSEWRDVQRIKEEMISSGFKRSTYAGESLDLGSEFEPLREQAARFQRSRTPSPSYIETAGAMRSALEKREIQNQILSELIMASDKNAEESRLGAKPKEARSLSKDMQESNYDEMRRINAEFQRSRSQSRSPLIDSVGGEFTEIESEAINREHRDVALDGTEQTSVNFHEFSRYLNAGFLDNERRASDSALIQKPEVLIQFQDFEADLDMEPEDYHHFRRYSLNQEQSVEEYPNDDFVYVSQIEVQTPNGTRTWIREDYYSEDFEKLNVISEESAATETVAIEEIREDAEEQVRVGEEDETDGSEDERQTVVEVEDEIDEDICDFNERGPADESHHETSECEEAEREMDHYADRDVNDWREIDNINELMDGEFNVSAADEGAEGGASAAAAVAYDSDSMAIDQIYDEAIKNRKQSGILRDYDNILMNMQQNYAENSTTDSSEAEVGTRGGNDHRAIWKKQQQLDNQSKEVESSLQLIENKHGESELRYLGDANTNARKSMRLRSRYGYVPQQLSNVVDDVHVDLNYKPKKEYNWRKNFKLEDEEFGKERVAGENGNEEEDDANGEIEKNGMEWRKFSLGGESITLFTRSPDRDNIQNTTLAYSFDDNTAPEEIVATNMKIQKSISIDEKTVVDDGELVEKPKKKKSKKKLRKETKKESLESYGREEDDSESQIYSQRRSSTQMETESPKRKSRSRRGSKCSLTNEDTSSALLLHRNSITNADVAGEVNNEQDVDENAVTTTLKKKSKKRKKAKDAFATEPDIKEEHASEMLEKLLEVDVDLTKNVLTASAAITPNTASINPLATLSPQSSICDTPGSIDSEVGEHKETMPENTKGPVVPKEVAQPTVTVATRTATTATTPTRTTVDTFDIMKDANFYPLF